MSHPHWKPRLAAAALCLACAAAGAVEINTATEAELDGTRGLGPASTARILEARKAGPFQHWADLMHRVKGIKAPTARKLSEAGLTVNGQAFEGHTPAPNPATSPSSPPAAAPSTLPATSP